MVAVPQNLSDICTRAVEELSSEPCVSHATRTDKDSLYQLHKTTRFRTDFQYNYAYADATVRSGYYDIFWENAFEDKQKVILKIEENGKIIGFSVVGEGELHQIYIHPDHQKKGHGQSLYNASATILAQQGYSKMHVNAIVANKNARSFYERMGAKYDTTIREDINRGHETYCIMCALYNDKNIGRFLNHDTRHTRNLSL